jgi:hypothetical protein
MRRYLFAAIAIFTLVLALTFPAAAPAAQPQAHHRIRAAIASLNAAHEELEHAAHDYGGHRADAMRAIDKAVEQLQICLQYDK